MAIKLHLRIQQFRQQRGLSQRGLAEKAGISGAGLSQIESGQTSPSVATLEKLADALELPLASFFSEQEEPSVRVELLTIGSRPIFQAKQGAEVIPLGSRVYSVPFEPILIRLNPGGEMSDKPFGVGKGVEFVSVQRGRAMLSYDEDQIEVTESQSVFYDPTKQHNWTNPFDGWCELLFVRCR
ncbi:MAG: helix-turn-helix domain-containing protein [Magnetococcales bacterium]|nr:helix-turn-helix domain-containing protein [Magnetococcales bacterium]NGZ05286.1 helix-turn-helix domain-containing protein [Magnetococcales bacterium]